MKILTNIRFAQTAGIAQVLFAFMSFVEKSKNINVNAVAVNIINEEKESYAKSIGKNTSTISIGVKVPAIADVMKEAKTLEDVERRYEPIIQSYQKAIQIEKPDIILVNGTYFMPWCLFIAAKRENMPSVLHYHGVLSKETSHWKKHERELFFNMEKSFDKDQMTYIFPSVLTKKVVENEVFGHKIKNCYIVPNPVPAHFFNSKAKLTKNNIGIISRWTRVKNVHFCERLAEYNRKRGAKFVLNVITDLDEKSQNYKKLSSIIKFHKPKNNNKLVSFYRDMSVVISPSHFETYGNVAKEAVATGTPAIVNANMGVSETFEKLGLKNWITEFSSVRSVYKKLEETAGTMVEQEVRGKMENLYSSQKIFGRIISILSGAI